MTKTKMKCVLTNWDYIYNLCRNLSNKIKDSDFKIDVVVALTRGGWIPGRILCDFIGLHDLVGLKIEHYVGTALMEDEAIVKYTVDERAVKDKNVLIIDDITDTGKSIESARDYILKLNPKDIKTAVLQFLFTSNAKIDFYAEYLDEWAWIIYPWNFIEDMVNIISRIMREGDKDYWSKTDIKKDLKDLYQIEPGRLDEVLNEIIYRGIIKEYNGMYILKETKEKKVV
ncbi:MAG: phosphoribosyltransferase [Candidatus Methanoliparum thermophilum]|uniref:Phosphoribosyltransferase n=1 Tax=Methanoliparum thermophilum TaxID=2491083 RepID=A0A520KSX1_METT2|nr:phosphoribosyltransferase [Candidatus Methanoliparum sp. LAM-1]RZN64984.1 MAG: phosphoribosyltransferase [Candidatus Methanoliparum thermophilum]BDC36131.1 phosphoribosyltransferase [Candidatus Methanoliparum sp. LAM-1]